MILEFRIISQRGSFMWFTEELVQRPKKHLFSDERTYVIHQTRFIETDSAVNLLTWAASLDWTSAVTCCNTYREYYVPVEKLSRILVFHIIVGWFCSSRHSNCLSHETQPDLFIVLYGWQFLVNFVFVWFCFIMHILPLPLCGLYGISVQNTYGPKSSRNIVLLTLPGSTQGSHRPIYIFHEE